MKRIKKLFHAGLALGTGVTLAVTLCTAPSTWAQEKKPSRVREGINKVIQNNSKPAVSVTQRPAPSTTTAHTDIPKLRPATPPPAPRRPAAENLPDPYKRTNTQGRDVNPARSREVAEGWDANQRAHGKN